MKCHSELARSTRAGIALLYDYKRARPPNGRICEMSTVIIVIFIAAFTVYCYSRRRSKLPLPPGPPSKFLTGNKHQLPKQEPWRAYGTWAETYGASSCG